MKFTTNFEKLCEASKEIDKVRVFIKDLNQETVLLALCEETGRRFGTNNGHAISTEEALASGYSVVEIIEDFFRNE